ncbi:MAG: flagellar motor switch protein FliM [Lentisphaerae bacterium]|nr:flagellar motor switch protein FliM [Lentisphaerota bacterium]
MTEMLSQDEVDALLNAVQKGEVDVAEPPADQTQQRKVEPYDFHKPHLISNEQLRGLQIIHDTFAKGLQSNLSGLLRTAIEVKLVAIDQLLYSEFVLSLYNPTFLTVVKCLPLTGTALIEMNLAIIMAIIDRLLGGTGATVPEPRELTPLELSIVRSVVNATLEEMHMAWVSTVDNIKFEVDSHDFNPEFLRIAPPEASVLSVTLDWRIGEATGVINICYPFSVIKPILPKLTSDSMVMKSSGVQSEQEKKRVLQSMMGVALDVSAVLGRCVLTADQVVNLTPGDVICLETRYDRPVEVVIEGKHCYLAEIGQRHGKLAVRLQAPVTAREEELPALQL